jgi:hypothetical protein
MENGKSVLRPLAAEPSLTVRLCLFTYPKPKLKLSLCAVKKPSTPGLSQRRLWLVGGRSVVGNIIPPL